MDILNWKMMKNKQCLSKGRKKEMGNGQIRIGNSIEAGKIEIQFQENCMKIIDSKHCLHIVAFFKFIRGWLDVRMSSVGWKNVVG
jgi:hypothetical protein